MGTQGGLILMPLAGEGGWLAVALPSMVPLGLTLCFYHSESMLTFVITGLGQVLVRLSESQFPHL